MVSEVLAVASPPRIASCVPNVEPSRLRTQTVPSFYDNVDKLDTQEARMSDAGWCLFDQQ